MSGMLSIRYNSWVIPIPYVSPVTYMFERIQYVDPKSIICIAISLADVGAVIPCESFKQVDRQCFVEFRIFLLNAVSG